MERTVPRTSSEEVELYIRTYYSLLRTTAEVKIQSLEEVHAGMNSLLHPGAREHKPDLSAFIYSILRLPACMPDVRLIVLGQSSEVFAEAGYRNGNEWIPISAPARRRRCFFDGENTLFCFIASRSDIDDVIPLLTAYQIEWNKIHHLLKPIDQQLLASFADGKPVALDEISKALGVSTEEVERLQTVWGIEFNKNIKNLASRPCEFGIRLLNGSLSEYRRATHSWWANIRDACPDLHERPVYFISSNTHSAVNLISGFALQKQEELVEFIGKSGDTDLVHEWEDIQASDVPSSRENFLYYVLKKYQQTSEGERLIDEQLEYERSCGIIRVPNERCFDIEAQVIDLANLNPGTLDPRLGDFGIGYDYDTLRQSHALILNIDYPLGVGAYNILSEVADHVGSVLGVFIQGKAATLNGVVGDVMIPNVVHDELSNNTYLFANCFVASDIAPYLVYGTVLDNQKAVSVLGTFLQNAHYMDVFYREGYTDIEMEAGPYLSAVYEMFRPKRHPINEIVNLYGLPFDLGIVHYASDTPLSKGKNLGAGSLSYYGMDSSYAATLAILRRIFYIEGQRQAKLQMK